MAGKMFIIIDKEELESMEETAYDSEAILQTLLVRYPDLLAGDQINPVTPRRWLLIGQEIGLPSIDSGPLGG